jgi:hypothetical protein
VKILYDKLGRASLRLLHSCFVTYAEGTHLGWLRGEAVHDLDGKPIGRYVDGLLRDGDGMIVAKELGAGPGNGAGVPDDAQISESWSPADCASFFRTHDARRDPGDASIGRAS